MMWPCRPWTKTIRRTWPITWRYSHQPCVRSLSRDTASACSSNKCNRSNATRDGHQPYFVTRPQIIRRWPTSANFQTLCHERPTSEYWDKGHSHRYVWHRSSSDQGHNSNHHETCHEGLTCSISPTCLNTGRTILQKSTDEYSIMRICPNQFEHQQRYDASELISNIMILILSTSRWAESWLFGLGRSHKSGFQSPSVQVWMIWASLLCVVDVGILVGVMQRWRCHAWRDQQWDIQL